MEQVEYEFPDEKEQVINGKQQEEAVDNEPEIDVVDDTPEEDRGREPMREVLSEVQDDELERYSEDARKRLKKFSKGYHDERREKERALREREEALRYAQQVLEENRTLKGHLNEGGKALQQTALHAAEVELAAARKDYKEAYEAGNADALVDAQERLLAARIRSEAAKNFRPPLQEVETTVNNPSQQEGQQPAYDPRADAWRKQNPWFAKDRAMTGFAFGLHEELVEAGIDPRYSPDEYWRRIDAAVREKFPEKFSESSPSENSRSRRAKTTVVAAATRSVGPRRVTLTTTQVAIAKRLGVPLELYARKVAEEMEKQNG